jgi:hydroxyacylglutathione hydrolase
VVLGSSLAGLAFNAVSPKGLPWITPPKPLPQAGDFMPLAQAENLWRAGNGFFLDARARPDYAAGHIAHALHLPAADFDAHFPQLAPLLSPETSIVIYCDGTDCELSHQVKEKLASLGYTNTWVLHNGWTTWRQAGLPTAKDDPQ